ncbi:hypothetical protein GCM10010987_21750 [Bradyrhizobium guangdongense]|uniref:Uncharacterized protein n=1 Tax=Bradyrhizobium guangdongense TaxID=1325090 RepID=A0AA88B7T6_9BRAD|nr:hypothetical protein GCM10010987_21750 [Bradyrhizobium guangdongense]
MRSQKTRGQKICDLLPEQGIQGGAAFEHIRRTQEQAGCNGVGMGRSFHEIGGSSHSGLNGDALERGLREVEMDDIQWLWNIPPGRRAGGNYRHSSAMRRSRYHGLSGAALEAK